MVLFLLAFYNSLNIVLSCIQCERDEIYIQ